MTDPQAAERLYDEVITFHSCRMDDNGRCYKCVDIFRQALAEAERRGLEKAREYASQCAKERSNQLNDIPMGDERASWVRCKMSEARRIAEWCDRQLERHAEPSVRQGGCMTDETGAARVRERIDAIINAYFDQSGEGWAAAGGLAAQLRCVADDYEALQQRLAEVERERDNFKQLYEAAHVGQPIGPLVGAQTIVEQELKIKALQRENATLQKQLETANSYKPMLDLKRELAAVRELSECRLKIIQDFKPLIWKYLNEQARAEVEQALAGRSGEVQHGE